MLSMLFVTVVEAKSYGSRSRSSSSRSYRAKKTKVNKIYKSKSKINTQKASTKASVPKIYKSNVNTNKLSKTDKKIRHSSQATKSKQALKAKKAQDKKITRKTPASKAGNKYAKRNYNKRAKTRYTKTYAKNRNVYINRYHIPTYYHSGIRSNYGILDSLYMWNVLSNINDRRYYRYYYSNRNNPDMIEWRRDMEIMALDNADLRAKLNAMDSKSNQLQSENYQVESNYIPDDYIAYSETDNTLPVQKRQPDKNNNKGLTILFVLILCGILILIFRGN